MSRINVLVAITKSGFVTLADGFAKDVARRDDMTLVEGRHVEADEAERLLQSIPTSPHCAVVIVGPPAEADPLARLWLARRNDIVVMLLDDSRDNIVRMAMSYQGLPEVLDALRDFVARVHAEGRPRVARLRLSGAMAQPPNPPTGEAPPDGPPRGTVPPHRDAPAPPPPSRERPLLRAAIAWVHHVLRDAIERVPDANGDVNGLSVTKKTLLDAFKDPRDSTVVPGGVSDAEAAVRRELEDADPQTEPLARAAYVFELDWLEFRMMVLGLAPELDLRFQRALGFLLDEMPRRVGTFAFYSTVLGSSPDVRRDLSEGGSLARWAIFDGGESDGTAADEPLRLDPFLAQWLLGVSEALCCDPRVRRVLRPDPWPGARLLKRPEDEAAATDLIKQLLNNDREQSPSDEPEEGPWSPYCDPDDRKPPHWLILDGDDPASWRALVELGSGHHCVMRVEPARLAAVDILDVERTARLIGRGAAADGRPLLIDVTGVGGTPEDDEWMRRFFFALGGTSTRAGVISTNQTRFVGLLGEMPFALLGEPPLSASAKIAAMQVAANEADVYLGEDGASSLLGRYPLAIDGLDHAARLAQSRPKDTSRDQPSLSRFVAALKEVASEGLSNLAERLDAAFTLESVVLPAERHHQLVEIVDNVRFARRVLDEWKFGAQLPYGHGIAALFHGPSGTGKTMAAIAIANRLGIQLLRVDLSRVVSKYIGDTEKNIDRVFSEAERTGSAILIDEAEALLGKRSEVKDAHDRYANIEVAYLLTRIERFHSRGHGGGLLFFTTNLRQSLDTAFLRRLRFIIEFPRPTVEAREQIWRQCLPRGSHSLNDADFKQLARRIDLTGGHIRQITLRAAFIAAAAGSLIELKHIAPAATAELAKLGMPAVDLDLNGSRQAA